MSTPTNLRRLAGLGMVASVRLLGSHAHAEPALDTNDTPFSNAGDSSSSRFADPS